MYREYFVVETLCVEKLMFVAAINWQPLPHVSIAHVSTFHVFFLAYNNKIYSMAKYSQSYPILCMGMWVSQNSVNGAQKLAKHPMTQMVGHIPRRLQYYNWSYSKNIRLWQL